MSTPSFSPCCGSPNIAQTGEVATLTTHEPEVPPLSAAAYVCGDCTATFFVTIDGAPATIVDALGFEVAV